MPKDTLIAESELTGVQFFRDVYVQRGIAYRGNVSERFEKNACKLLLAQGLEVRGRMGTLPQETTVTLSRTVLYSRRNDAGANDRGQRLLFKLAQAADHASEHLFQ